MEPFPFFRRPYYYYDRDRYINQYNIQNRENIREQANQRRAEQERRDYQNQTLEPNSRRNQTHKVNQSQATQKINEQELIQEDSFIEIFGIKLYFDDILIIALIFFLYSEGVKDNSLFISLILLLLS